MTLPRCMDNTTQTKGVTTLPELVGRPKANRPHSSPQETDHLKLLECKDHDGGNTNSTSGQEMAGYGIKVSGISKTRWIGMGSRTLQGGERVVYMGDEEVHRGGVTIMMGVRAKRALIKWMKISKRRTIKA